MDYVLKVGEWAVVRRNVLATTWAVTYAGSPSDDRYSIVLTWTAGYHASSYNLYLTDSVREIPFKGGRLRFREMSPERIEFRYERT